MQLDNVIGNGSVISSLKTALDNTSLSHGILLTAPDGCGRGYVARCLAADYLAPQGGPAADAVMKLESPELLVVEGEGKSGQIPVDKIRAVRKDIYHSSLSSTGRVVWIRDAHMMAAPSANALLKVLEEPPEGAVFILTARDAASLPATIVSRCALYPLSAVDYDECADALRNELAQEQDQLLPETLARVYSGRIGLGLQAIRNEQRLAVVKDAMNAAKAISKQDTYRLLSIFAQYEGRADGDREKREFLLSDIADVIMASLHTGENLGVPGFPVWFVPQALACIQQTRTALRGNAAAKITFAALAVKIADTSEM